MQPWQSTMFAQVLTVAWMRTAEQAMPRNAYTVCLLVSLIAVDEPARAQLQALATELLSNVARATAGAAPPSETGSTASNRPDAIHLWPTFAWAPEAASTAPASAAAAPAGTLGQQDPQSDAADQQLPLHLSISRTVPIKRIQIDSLQAALSKQLKPFKSCRVQLQGLVCLVNDAATRSFVGIRVATGEKQVSSLHSKGPQFLVGCTPRNSST